MLYVRKLINFSVYVLAAFCAGLPFIAWLIPLDYYGQGSFSALNFVAWILVAVLWYSRQNLHESIARRADELGIEVRLKSIERLTFELLHEIERKNASFSINLVQQKISSRQELSRALEKVVGQAYRLLGADSAELALFDEVTGLYHSALVVGKPFRVSAQAMLSGAASGEVIEISPDVLIQPIAFAGSVLGTLRVALKEGRLPTLGDRDIVNLLALQAGLALMNAQYSHELVRMQQHSEESVRAKTGFLANLSHEIRGPLGIILNAVELVLDGLCGEINEDQRDTLKMAHSNGAHLLELISDVLDYAKVESGRITPNPIAIVVQPLLQDLCGVIRGQAEIKKHKVVCRASDDAMSVRCDRRHLRQMLINLMTNAVKYTPEGGQIEVWAERMPGGKVRINVQDTGVGIAEADRAKVFAPFERIENAYSISQVGTGLGMPLTKRLAEVNGGVIDFESLPGKGSKFWVVLAASSVNAQQIIEDDEDSKLPPVAGRGNHIMLLEKNAGERNMTVKYLSHLGFKVSAAERTVEAIDILRSTKIDLAIVGNNVVDDPKEDLVSLIRNNAKNSSLPIVLISSRAFTFDIERYLRSGVDRCLIKPLKLREIAQTCRDLIDGTFRGEIVDRDVLSPDNSKSKSGEPKLESVTKVISARDIAH